VLLLGLKNKMLEEIALLTTLRWEIKPNPRTLKGTNRELGLDVSVGRQE
jgi:hypothetical protein